MWVCERSWIALAPSSGRNKQMQALLTWDRMNVNIFSGEKYICYEFNYKHNIYLTCLYSYQLLCREHNWFYWNKIIHPVISVSNRLLFSFLNVKMWYSSAHSNILFFNEKQKQKKNLIGVLMCHKVYLFFFFLINSSTLHALFF